MNKYVFTPYDPLFPILFSSEKKRLAQHLPIGTLIEHVGSTAIPNLGGKGIIDIAIGSEDFSIRGQIEVLGYEFRESGSTSKRLYFRQDLPDPLRDFRRYHLHLMPPFSNEWKEMLYFRDYLRSHPDEVKNYAEIKKMAAEEVSGDGVNYRGRKRPFFEKVLNTQEPIKNHD